jgi:hypothetical protein
MSGLCLSINETGRIRVNTLITPTVLLVPLNDAKKNTLRLHCLDTDGSKKVWTIKVKNEQFRDDVIRHFDAEITRKLSFIARSLISRNQLLVQSLDTAYTVFLSAYSRDTHIKVDNNWKSLGECTLEITKPIFNEEDVENSQFGRIILRSNKAKHIVFLDTIAESNGSKVHLSDGRDDLVNLDFVYQDRFIEYSVLFLSIKLAFYDLGQLVG